MFAVQSVVFVEHEEVIESLIECLADPARVTSKVENLNHLFVFTVVTVFDPTCTGVEYKS